MFALAACGTAGPATSARPSVAPFVAGVAPAYPGPPEAIAEIRRCDVRTARGCFARFPGGRLRMGAQASDPAAPNFDPRARPDEAPVREVDVPDLWVMRTEAEVAVAAECLRAGWCDPGAFSDAALASMVHLPNDGSRIQGLPDRAVTGVSWAGARQLCAYVGARLPTEAEWEWLARGPEARVFPWGSEPGCGLQPLGVASCELQGVSSFADLVGGRSGGDFDLLGMGGNVWEWTEDVYVADAYAGGQPSAEPSAARVQRGGGWLCTDPWELRAAARGAADPSSRLPDVGVRCVRDVP